jgi:hypothetical protein
MDDELAISQVMFVRRLNEEREDKRDPRSEPRDRVADLLESQRWV